MYSKKMPSKKAMQAMMQSGAGGRKASKRKGKAK